MYIIFYIAFMYIIFYIALLYIILYYYYIVVPLINERSAVACKIGETKATTTTKSPEEVNEETRKNVF